MERVGWLGGRHRSRAWSRAGLEPGRPAAGRGVGPRGAMGCCQDKDFAATDEQARDFEEAGGGRAGRTRLGRGEAPGAPSRRPGRAVPGRGETQQARPRRRPSGPFGLPRPPESQVQRQPSDHRAVAAPVLVQPPGLLAGQQEALGTHPEAGEPDPGGHGGGEPGGAGEGMSPGLLSVRPSPQRIKFLTWTGPTNWRVLSALWAKGRAPRRLRAL